MAKVRMHQMFLGLRGRLGNVVYRLLNGETVAGKVPDFSHRRLSADQRTQIKRFTVAVPQAKRLLADPVQRAICEAEARASRRPIMAVAISKVMMATP